MLDFLSPKGLRAEVTEGIDLENAVMLTGKRVTVGSGSGDTLRLGAADVVPGHLTFERRADGRGWDYFTSDRGVTQIDKGNPRTGQVRPGMWLRLGRETRIDLSRTALPAAAQREGDSEPASVPMPVAFGILAAIGLAVAVSAGALGGSGSRDLSLQTTPLVSGGQVLSAALDVCLATTVRPDRAIAASDPASAFWRVMAYRNSDRQRAEAAKTELDAEVRHILAAAHLLHRESKELEASQTLRRLEYVLPVGSADCPILRASRFDLALLEVRGTR